MAVAGTSFDRSFPLELDFSKIDPPHQGGKRIADRFASFLGAFEKAKREIVTGRLSESPNFLLPLMLKNSCRKLTHRAATIGAVGVSSAGKAGLLVWNSRE